MGIAPVPPPPEERIKIPYCPENMCQHRECLIWFNTQAVKQLNQTLHAMNIFGFKEQQHWKWPWQ